METAFTFDTEILSNQAFLNSISYGHATMNVKVHGFWSNSSITLYVRRSWNEEWEVEVSHSSGGRDTKELKSNLDAEINFGKALIAISEFGKMLETKFDMFEQLYQENMEQLKAQAAEEAEEKQAKLDQDPAINSVQIKLMLNQLVSTETKMSISAQLRASDEKVNITYGSVQGYTHKKFQINGRGAYSRAKIELLMQKYSMKNTTLVI